METLLLQITNMKWHVAYRIVAITMIVVIRESGLTIIELELELDDLD